MNTKSALIIAAAVVGAALLTIGHRELEKAQVRWDAAAQEEQSAVIQTIADIARGVADQDAEDYEITTGNQARDLKRWERGNRWHSHVDRVRELRAKAEEAARTQDSQIMAELRTDARILGHMFDLEPGTR